MPLIQSNVNVVQWSDWFAAFTDSRAPDRFSVRFDRAQMSIDAATQGLGVALESATIAARHIADGRLKPVFGLDAAVNVKAHFAVYPDGTPSDLRSKRSSRGSTARRQKAELSSYGAFR